MAAHLIVVHQEAPKHLDVFGTKRRAARGDRGGDAGEMAGHDVGVSLNDDGLLLLGDVAAGKVDAVQHLTLLI